MKYDAVIIGAGIIGLLTALELHKASLNVCIIDQGSAGKESSWAGGGILLPVYPWKYPAAINRLVMKSLDDYPAFFNRLKKITGIDPEWQQCGHLILDDDLDDASHWSRQYGIYLEEINQVSLNRIEPSLSNRFDKALWLPEITQVRNPDLLKALYKHIQQERIPLQENCAATGLSIANGKVSAVETVHGNISCATVIITAGAWSGRLFKDITLPPITPVLGQMIQYQLKPCTIRTISLYQGKYVIPRKDGKILVGSTLEHTGFNKTLSGEACNHLADAASTRFPELSHTPVINHWAGLRPGNTRQTPYICEHPDIHSLYFNTGHFRNGIVLGLASASLCADLILNRETSINLSDYAMY